MKKRLFTIIMAATLILSNFATPLQTKAANATTEKTKTASLTVGDTFKVDDITYTITSVSELYTAEPTNISNSKTEIIIPSSVTYNSITFQITNIPDGAFYKKWLAKKIVISEGIKTVGEMAFQFNDGVTELYLPSTLESFTTSGFKSLKTINLAEGNEHFTLIDGVLFTKDGLSLWLYPSGSTETSYFVPEETRIIKCNSFYNNQNLESVILPSSITTIEDYAFYELQKLANIEFNHNVVSFGKYNLYNCPELKSLTLKNSGAIGDYCIYNCPELKTITLGGGFDGYGSYSLYELPSLEEYIVEDVSYIESVDGVLFNGDKLLRYPSAKVEEGNRYVVPENTTSIAALAFCSLQNTTEFILTPGISLSLMSFYYPNTDDAVSIYFRDKEEVSLSNAKSGVFVGLNEGSKIYLPTEAALESFLSYENAINPSGSATVEIGVIPISSMNFSETNIELDAYGTTKVQLSVDPYYATETPTYSSSDINIASIANDGTITAKNVGTCTVTATASSGTTTTCNVKVNQKDIESAVFEQIEDCTYTGLAWTPNVTIKFETHTLTENKDYIVVYENNIDAGTAKAIISGIGNFNGSKELFFEIEDRNLSYVTADAIGNQTYDGTEQTPEISLKDGNIKLHEGKDYNTEYKNNIDIGTAEAIAKGKGNYSGNKNVSFSIVPDVPDSISANLYGYNDIKISWIASDGATGYYLYYKKSSEFTYTFLGRTTNTYYQKENLSNGTLYNFKIVPYALSEGKTYKGSFSDQANVYTLKKCSKPKVSKASSKKVKVKWTNIAGETGYQISATTSKKKTKIVKTINSAKKASTKIKMKKGKAYYYKIRAFKVVDGAKIYSPWSKVRKFKLK